MQPQPRRSTSTCQPITSPSLPSPIEFAYKFRICEQPDTQRPHSVHPPPQSTKIPSCLLQHSLQTISPARERTVLFHQRRLFLTQPPPRHQQAPWRAKKNGPRMGLTRPFSIHVTILDPSSIPAPCLPTVPIIYVQVRVRTRPCRRRRDLAATCAPLRITW